jgi:hypothetical protein
MKTNSPGSWPVALVVIILVITSCAISYKIIHTFCDLASKSNSDSVSLELIKDQMQALKDWGGIVLGFFFGAAFNFVTVAVAPWVKKSADEPEPSPPAGPENPAPSVPPAGS